MQRDPRIDRLAVERELVRRSPASMAEVLSRGFTRPPHIELLDRIIVDAVMTPNSRVIVSLPVRHGKTELLSRWTPPWFLSLFPDKHFGVCTYGDDLSAELGRFARDRVREHSELLGIDVDPESSAANRWSVAGHRGGMYAVGVGGGITGRGVSCLVIDDPVKDASEAFSPTVREHVWQWFDSTASTRLEPGGSILIVMTRWHDDDLAGRLLKRSREDGGEQWTEIRIPALAEENDPLGRQPGEALWPERYDREWLEHLRRNKDAWVWAALYQQRPIADVSGTGLREDELHRWTTLPSGGFYVASWDLAMVDPTKPAKGNKRSQTSGQVWYVLGGRAYLVDAVSRHMDFAEQESLVKLWHESYHCRRTHIERAANGHALLSRLSTQIQNLNPVDPRGSKFLRFSAVCPYFRNGAALLPQDSFAPWVRSFVETLVNFPNVDHDDPIDATSQLLSQEFLPDKVGEESGEDRAKAWKDVYGAQKDADIIPITRHLADLYRRQQGG